MDNSSSLSRTSSDSYGLHKKPDQSVGSRPTSVKYSSSQSTYYVTCVFLAENLAIYSKELPPEEKKEINVLLRRVIEHSSSPTKTSTNQAQNSSNETQLWHDEVSKYFTDLKHGIEAKKTTSTLSLNKGKKGISESTICRELCDIIIHQVGLTDKASTIKKLTSLTKFEKFLLENEKKTYDAFRTVIALSGQLQQYFPLKSESEQLQLSSVPMNITPSQESHFKRGGNRGNRAIVPSGDRYEMPAPMTANPSDSYIERDERSRTGSMSQYEQNRVITPDRPCRATKDSTSSPLARHTRHPLIPVASNPLPRIDKSFPETSIVTATNVHSSPVSAPCFPIHFSQTGNIDRTGQEEPILSSGNVHNFTTQKTEQPNSVKQPPAKPKRNKLLQQSNHGSAVVITNQPADGKSGRNHANIASVLTNELHSSKHQNRRDIPSTSFIRDTGDSDDEVFPV
ncbi:hypothetical protein [uncultured Endozoicomonas sp.]|uniref:hypothetical protein n=1 Tax=uncultured Endozoicomonas sp. TaxID=432652 RepID=UPI002620C682|nr:hypothetical protein [uncultured Endozoicomonas sp.]